MPTRDRKPGSFGDWAETVPSVIKAGPLWGSIFYQRALFLYDLCWYDCEVWSDDPRGRAVAQQIIRSCGSISANMEEGYGRGFGKDYARFLSISLGSARETKGWYFRGRHLMKPDVFEHRISLVDEVISMLIPIIIQQRTRPKK